MPVIRCCRAAALLGAVLWGGCTVGASSTDVIGTFVLNHPDVLDSLTLLPTQVYVHSYQRASERPISDTGRWKWDSGGDGNRLVLSDFAMWVRKVALPSVDVPRGTWVVKPERAANGQIRLHVDRDVGLMYVRPK